MVSDEITIKGENPKDDLNRYKQIYHQDTTERITLTYEINVLSVMSSFPVVLQGFLIPSLDSNPVPPGLAG